MMDGAKRERGTSALRGVVLGRSHRMTGALWNRVESSALSTSKFRTSPSKRSLRRRTESAVVVACCSLPLPECFWDAA